MEGCRLGRCDEVARPRTPRPQATATGRDTHRYLFVQGRVYLGSHLDKLRWNGCEQDGGGTTTSSRCAVAVLVSCCGVHSSCAARMRRAGHVGIQATKYLEI